MKRIMPIFLIQLLVAMQISGQNNGRITSSLNNNYSDPGFVIIPELSAAPGIGDTGYENSSKYLGATAILGYQIDRNFLVGAGTGFFNYENTGLIPLFIELRYTVNKWSLNPFIFADGGLLIDYKDINQGTKIFINPGGGISKSISPRCDITAGAGLMVQMGDNVPRTSYFNVRAGLILRRNTNEMRKTGRRFKGHCPY